MYQYVWYMNPYSEHKLGKWLGVVKLHGVDMTYWILPNLCRLIVQSSVLLVSKDKMNLPGVQALIAALDADIYAKIGNKRSDQEVANEFSGLFLGKDSAPTEEDNLEDTFKPKDEGGVNKDVDRYMPDTYDEYLMADKIKLLRGEEVLREEVLRAHVIGHKHDQDGNPVG